MSEDQDVDAPVPSDTAVADAFNAASRGKRTQKTWYVTEEVIARASAAAYWCLPTALASAQTRGVGPDVHDVPDSASALVERGMWSEILRLESTLNNGRPFPPAPGRLRPGPGQSGISRLRHPRGNASMSPLSGGTTDD